MVEDSEIRKNESKRQKKRNCGRCFRFRLPVRVCGQRPRTFAEDDCYAAGRSPITRNVSSTRMSFRGAERRGNLWLCPLSRLRRQLSQRESQGKAGQVIALQWQVPVGQSRLYGVIRLSEYMIQHISEFVNTNFRKFENNSCVFPEAGYNEGINGGG